MTQKRLRETRAALCGGRSDCEQRFDDIVADYRHRYGRRATGMACRRVKGTPGLSLRINRGHRRVNCRFARLLYSSGVLADAELEAAMGGTAPNPGQIGTARLALATAYPGRLRFAVRNQDGPGMRQMRCPDLGSGG